MNEETGLDKASKGSKTATQQIDWPFDLEKCPNCDDPVRDCEGIEIVEGEQSLRHWCENCGWEAIYVYEVKFLRKED